MQLDKDAAMSTNPMNLVRTTTALLILSGAIACGPTDREVVSTFPGIVIDFSAAESGRYIGSPSLAVLSNGDYVSSHDFFGPGSGEKQAGETRVFRSRDRGETWEKLCDLEGQFWSGLFVHQGSLYIMGSSRQIGSIVIRRSDDGGESWTSPRDGESGLLEANQKYHTAPMPTVVHAGRIWRSMELGEGSRPEWGALVMSAPTDADLLKAVSWTQTSVLHNNDSDLRWIEGNVVVTPEQGLVNILRTNGLGPGKAAVTHISEDGRRLFWNPEEDLIDFIGGGAKFTIRYDEQSKRYWSIVNKQKDPETYRNLLTLTSSEDLRSWRLESILVNQLSREDRAFQYVDWLFEGDDIIAVSRTAWDGANRPHDANYMTFHRIKGFRQRTLQSPPLY
jgi:hypothetical protein